MVRGRLRTLVQALVCALTNGYLKGFMPPGSIYAGPLKQVCVPGMNCYSCPGALGSCPIGALQAHLTGREAHLSAYVIGFLASVGLVAGRFVCAWLCPFGWLQELLHKVPLPKVRLSPRVDGAGRILKYVVLLMLVLVLPASLRDSYDLGVPIFCAYLCPVGIIEGALPLFALSEDLRAAAGTLFWLKLVVTLLVVVGAMVVYRPFCKYLCPLGATYALFQRVSLVRLQVDAHACVRCGTCARTCKMGVDPTRSANACECIRCLECVDACPVKAISLCGGGRVVLAPGPDRSRWGQ